MDILRKDKLYEIVFEADTKPGRTFDIGLLILIILSIIFVSLESVKSLNEKYGDILNICEWLITSIFTFEYALRIYVVKKKFSYIFSFF